MNYIIFYKSHFKFNMFGKRNKKLFLKNILINLFFLKILIINCVVSLQFFKKKQNYLNILKAPSRHKKFVHRYFMEFFFVRFSIQMCSLNNCLKTNQDILFFFLLLQRFSSLFTSSLLMQTKVFFSLNVNFNLFLLA